MPSRADAFVSARDPGSQRWERWAALSLSKASTSQYQQGSTMWATWEEEMEFLLVLLRRSQTHSQCPLVPLIAWVELKDRGRKHTRAMLFILAGAFYVGWSWSLGPSAESQEWGARCSSDYLKYFKLPCSCSISPDFHAVVSLHLCRPLCHWSCSTRVWPHHVALGQPN